MFHKLPLMVNFSPPEVSPSYVDLETVPFKRGKRRFSKSQDVVANEENAYQIAGSDSTPILILWITARETTKCRKLTL